MCWRWAMLAALAFGPVLHAEKYAVVVGVGKYPSLTNNDLEGARPDAEKMAAVLSSRFGYDPAHMTVLLDEAATRAAILRALEDVAAKIHDGDRVVVYYSGHGTSSLDKETGGFGMDAATGAIIPSDIKLSHNKDDVLKELLIGRRDLRPIFERMEAKADVLVIFDACFSGESVKSIMPLHNSALRYLSLADLTEGDVSSKALRSAQTGATRSSSAPFPYRRVVYIAAAANNQFAYDINSEMMEKLRGRFQTVDGMPHGALTNALLKVLAEEPAQAGQPRAVCRTLFDKAVSIVQDQEIVIGPLTKGHQEPQLLYSAEDSSEVERPCFDARGGIRPPQQPVPPPQTGPVTDVRGELDRIVSGADGVLACHLDHPSYHPGDWTIVECAIPSAGYVNVLGYGAGDPSAVLLWPNRKDSNVRVQAGTLRIPSGRWHIGNTLPPRMESQPNTVVVLFSEDPISLQSFSVPMGDTFASVDAHGARSFRSQSVVPAYAAAKLEFMLTRR